MREIGGYIELDNYTLPMLHEDAIHLNCGRNALAYLIRAKNIKQLYLPKFNCSTVNEVCCREQISVVFYSITENFRPQLADLPDGAWLYLVNFYGQISNEEIVLLKEKYKRVIVDNAHAYYQMPVVGVDTLYTCRKFFGVPDGAFLYTDVLIDEPLERDESFERMRHILGRFERTASEFYSDSVANNEFFTHEPIKYMSRLTENLLHGIDYERVKHLRTNNFRQLHALFKEQNKLNLVSPVGAFMYPLYLQNGVRVRKALQEKKIYIPVLWPNVLKLKDMHERDYAENILPLPCDQRYGEFEMSELASAVRCEINKH